METEEQEREREEERARQELISLQNRVEELADEFVVKRGTFHAAVTEAQRTIIINLSTSLKNKKMEWDQKDDWVWFVKAGPMRVSIIRESMKTFFESEKGKADEAFSTFLEREVSEFADFLQALERLLQESHPGAILDKDRFCGLSEVC